jgi:hypothetical protein
VRAPREQQRRQQEQGEPAAEKDAQPDQASKSLERREIDEEQREERCRRRTLRENHARCGAGHPGRCAVDRSASRTLFEIAHVQEDDAIDPETEQHARRTARGR